jgi:hypothetical protein
MSRSPLPASACTALAIALCATPLAAQGDVRSLSVPRVAAQVGAGAIATPIGFFAVGVLTDRVFEQFGRDDETTSRISMAAAWAGATLATGAGPALVGARGPGAAATWRRWAVPPWAGSPAGRSCAWWTGTAISRRAVAGSAPRSPAPPSSCCRAPARPSATT